MAAFRWIVSTLAAVLPLLLAHIAVPETLASIAAALDYFPYDMSFITTCVNVGLTCSDNGYVTQINWQYKAIQGELPSEIFQLMHLEYLYMRQNNFSGSIPDAIGNMVSLNDIDLTDNSFSGSLPASMGQLTNLNNISLRGNRFRGSIPAAFAANVFTSFDVSVNDLSGPLPSGLRFSEPPGGPQL
ncbi:hypothetical protein CLOM_g23590 [Closterium sp. NIES-68]|nr:hypothetical protein CLOM_g23590 [Closterium sp. NIES-68]